MVSQLFLGIRLECAKCHHHPFEVWGQDDFYSLAAYFARVGHKGAGIRRRSPAARRSSSPARRRGEASAHRPGRCRPAAVRQGDATRRGHAIRASVLADWIRRRRQPVFRRGHRQSRLGRPDGPRPGRAGGRSARHQSAEQRPACSTPWPTTSASRGYDLKKLIRTITTSYVYGLSSLPNERNVGRHCAIIRATIASGCGPRCCSTPSATSRRCPRRSPRCRRVAGDRAVDGPVAIVFLDSFGRPDPNQDPPCERTSDTTVVQALAPDERAGPAPQGDEPTPAGPRAWRRARRRRRKSSTSCICWLQSAADG